MITIPSDTPRTPLKGGLFKHTLTRARPRTFGSRIWILVGLLLCLPVISYTALELARLNEQETLIENLYRAQLGAILFSVNQYCWDVVSGWGNSLCAELAAAEAWQASVDQIQTSLAKVQQRHGPTQAAFTYEWGHIKLALVDSLSPQREQIATRIVKTISANAREIDKMNEHAGKGYFRPVALKLEPAAAENDVLLFAFAGEHGRLEGLLVSSEQFVRQILQPKISEFETKSFVLAVKRTSDNALLLTTRDLRGEVFEYEEPLWIFPNLTLAIKLRSANTAEIAATRTRRTLWLMLGIDAVILVTVVLILRVLAREAQLARLKSNFVDNVSHDLRTPLGLIRMFAETLQMGRVPSEEKKQEYYGVLARETERLTRMVNNLLDFSRIEAGKKVYEPKAANLAGVLAEVLNSYRYYLEQRGFELVETISPDIPLIKADAEAVSQAFVNLLDNAVKYSDERRHITVALFREEHWAVIEVTDRGLGIDAKHRHKIFDKFYRVETVGRDTRGAGIGLALAQHVMAAHNGKVEVKSELGKGSSFYLKFPMQSS